MKDKKLRNKHVWDKTIDESENLTTKEREPGIVVEKDKTVNKKESSIILKLIISFFTGGGFSTLIGKMLGEETIDIFQLIDSMSAVVVVFLICLTIIVCILINRVFDLKEIEINNKESQRDKMLQESIQTIKKNNV